MNMLYFKKYTSIYYELPYNICIFYIKIDIVGTRKEGRKEKKKERKWKKEERKREGKIHRSLSLYFYACAFCLCVHNYVLGISRQVTPGICEVYP